MLRSRKVRALVLLVAAGVLAAIGSALAVEGEGGEGQDDPIAVTEADQQLLDRLLALGPELPPLLPTEADLAANRLDGVLLGSFASARSTLERLEDDVRQLFIDGDEADTAVGDAVASVARGLLIEQQAYLVLEQSDGSTNPRPLDSSNVRTDDGLAIDADGLLGIESIGIDLLIQARDLERAGYEVLAAVEDTDPAFDERLEELRRYEEEVGVTLRVITSANTDELLVPAERYDAPIGVPRAVSVTYVCVDRAEYLLLADLPQEERVAASLEEVPGPECVELARRAGLSLEDQQAAQDAPDDDDAAGDGTDTGDEDA